MVEFDLTGWTDFQIMFWWLVGFIAFLAVVGFVIDRIQTRHWREHEKALDEMRKLYPPDDS